jgi:hypothetical protein
VTDRRSTLEFAPGFPKALAAVEFAQRSHYGQRRKVDGEPFILHPLEVASLLYQAGASDEVVAAGVLHDTIEKTATSASDLTKRFGSEVTALVCAVSEDERISGYAHRKAALREQVSKAGREALMVFAADKVSKVRELRLGRGAAAIGATVLRRRLLHYRRCLALLEERLPDVPVVRMLRTELDSVPEPISPPPVFARRG